MPMNSADWQLQSLRLTLFPAAVVDDAAWFEKFAGAAADATTTSAKQQLHQSEARWRSGQLTLRTAGLRSDWIYAPTEDEQGATPVVPLPAEVPVFVEAIERWLALAPPLTRVAFGVVAVIPVDTRAAGFTRLRSVVGEALPTGDFTDFLYQISRRVDSTAVGTVQINKLSKWAVQATRPVTLMLGPSGASQQMGPETHAVRMELDINTALPDDGLQPSFRLTVELMRELSTIALDFAGRGLEVIR